MVLLKKYIENLKQSWSDSDDRWINANSRIEIDLFD